MTTHAAPPPNIVLIITDDQGYGDVGIHGNERIRTPNMDRLARESVRFNRFYVCPVCSPTRAGLMTGRWNYRTGVVDTYLGRSMMHPDEVTLAEALRAGGYRTGIFGKWHLGDNYPMRPQDQGFDEGLINKGGGITQPSDPEGNSYFDPILYRNGRAVKTKGYCTDVITDAALQFMERNRRRPFFAYIATVAPHVPLQIADRYWKPYADAGLDETTAKVYGMVENIDENVGRVMDGLRRLDLERNTILIFMGDNGPQQPRFNGGLRGLKGSVYEGGIRVPFFIRWPAALQPRVAEPIGANVDIMPTLLDLAGVAPPPGVRLDGISLRSVLHGGPSAAPDRALFYQWHRGDAPEPWRDCCVLTQTHKLVNGKELYDVEQDPAETTNIAAEHPDLVRDLRRRYEGWFADVSATRGYAPPRIVLGSSRENPSVLTRQDWRGPRATWNPDGEGHWEVEVVRAAEYDITLRLWPDRTPARVGFACGSASEERTVRSGARTCTFAGVRLSEGPARLEAWMEGPLGRSGVMYVSVRRRAGTSP
ncbi:MAG: arylsulfatase [Chthonomonadales bacterium]|nr:arylsulfatase [Chthonomonadales bacterium]